MLRVEFLRDPQPDFDPEEVATNLSLPRIGWMEYSACRGEDQAIFYPGSGETGTAAKEICDRCFVKRDCLANALDDPQAMDFGIRGGQSERARNKIRPIRTALRKVAS